MKLSNRGWMAVTCLVYCALVWGMAAYFVAR
uniref:Uncharacterized protein n=2 Tax=unclassified Rosemountvirus TaxID=2738372 RepID=A0AAU8GFS1_9CAUD